MRSTIGWTALSVVLPGAAHLRAGHRKAGAALLGLYLVAVAAGIFLAGGHGLDLAGLLLSPRWSGVLIGVTVLLGLAWFALVLRSYVVMRPGALPGRAQIASGMLAGTLAVLVTVPFAVAAEALLVSSRTLDEMFAASPARVPPADPWRGRERVNFLLIGGDWSSKRKVNIGIRTDSMTVASVDIKTGNTVLLSLPREMENAPFPAGSPFARRFPEPKNFYLPGPQRASGDLLNAVWMYAERHGEPGAATLMGVVGEIVGLDIDYYVLVNMWGLAELIDAIGGIEMTVEKDIPYNTGRRDAGVVKAGTRRLTGGEALWYGRARDHDQNVGAGDNAARMGRQRCLMNALLREADPATVLANVHQVAAATRRSIQTDIPRDLLEHLVPLAARAKSARTSGVMFVKPLIDPAYPDFDKIRSLTAKAVGKSMAPPAPKRTGKPRASLDRACS